MKKRTILTIVVYVVAVGLGYMLYAGVKSTMDIAKSIKKQERLVTDKLSFIRDAEKAFLDAQGRYTANWDSLRAFLRNGHIYRVEKSETIVPRPAGEEWKGDSVLVSYDTLGTEKPLDVLRRSHKAYNVDSLEYIPNKAEKKFEVFADTATRGTLVVNLIEVVDKYPVDRTRKEDNDNAKRRFLRFGSRENATVAGNWGDK